MQNRTNGEDHGNVSQRNKGLINPEVELRCYRALCADPEIQAVMVKVVNDTTTRKEWQERFSNISQNQGQVFVAALAAVSLLTSAALIQHHLDGRDVLRGVGDIEQIAKVAEETKQSAGALTRLALIVQINRRTSSGAGHRPQAQAAQGQA